MLLSPLLVASDLGWLTELRGIAVALELGLLATAAAYVLFARGLTAVAVAGAATLSLAEPLTAGLLGALMLGERVGLAALLGVSLVVAGWPWTRSGGKPLRTGVWRNRVQIDRAGSPPLGDGGILVSILPTTSACACSLGVINRVRRRWSSTQDRRWASCFCRAGGSSSAPSRGRHALGAWSRITNGCRRPWRGCTSSLSRA